MATTVKPHALIRLAVIVGDDLVVTFYGVRGSTPCHGPEVARYGGNTSCVAVHVPGQAPVVFDLGTGLRYFGRTVPADEPLRASCLIGHLHWDHIQGLPFFQPLLREGGEFHIYAPKQEDGRSAYDVLKSTITPPMFPVELHGIPASLHFHDVVDADFSIGSPDSPISVMARQVPHVGMAMGYRISWGGLSVAYLSDHQQPPEGYFADDAVRELCAGADLLIHDAQYLPEELAAKPDWGHCTAEFAVWLAEETGVRRLALFHHDPDHDDHCVDQILAAARARATTVDVVAASERTSLTVSAPR